MSTSTGFYRWESRCELVSSHAEEAAIYYEWLLGLGAGSRPGDALRRVGVDDVRLPQQEEPSGWLPVFFVDDAEEALGRLGSGDWSRALVERGGELRCYVSDERGVRVRLDTRAEAPADDPASRSAVNFDCATPHLAETAEFYARLLGLRVVEVPEDRYDMRLLCDDQGVTAGVFRLHGMGELGRRPFWITYFEVDSVEDSITRAVHSGSRVRIPPADSPFNRYAVLDDPWGNLYGFSTMHDAHH
ncbi:VOC family protein [Leucobacter iarius]|uniref:VOC domain-containing protein n=1 Tax=Leucobacter iarius TaxID=333963 RepID=A0ABN2L936_9MICO